MAKAIKMPDLATTAETVTIVKWLKQVGDPVSQGEPLCEVQTDKAVTELESVASGILLQQVAAENQEVKTGDIVAYIGRAGEQVNQAEQ